MADEERKELKTQPRVRDVRIQELIIVEVLEGKGTSESPARRVKYVYDMEGQLVAMDDPCKGSET